MGLFSSDYEANGSTSINQLGQQRHHDDTYIGDLIIANLHTGKNIAENIRDEISVGPTAFGRRYHQRGYTEGFYASISYNGVDEEEIILLPVVSIKDNGNKESQGSFMGFHPLEIPYYKNPKDSEMLKRRIRVMNGLGIDFVDLSKGIFEPDPIPEFGSSEWGRDYGRMYKDAVKLCAKNKAPKDVLEICKHPTERAYYDDLVKNQEKQKESIDDITDVNVGFFTGMKTLDVANAAALFMTLQPIMDNLERSNSEEGTSGEILRQLQYEQLTHSGPAATFKWKMTAGTLIISYSMADYSYVRRQGIVEYDWETIPKLRKKKTSWKICKVSELTEDDPIVETIVASSLDKIKEEEVAEQEKQDQDKEDWDIANPGVEYEGDTYDEYDDGSDMVLELRMQDLPDKAGNPTYLEMRLIGLAAMHHVDVLRDTSYGKSFNVGIRGTLQGFEDEDYEDIIVFPISKYAFDELPTFLRERFSREALCVIVDGITVNKVKWYQQGWFKVVMFIVAVALAMFTGGQSLTVYNILITAIKVFVVSIVTNYVMSLIDNPLLAALLVIVVAVFVGKVDFSNLTTVASLAVEATGTYLQKQFAQEMLKLQQEAKDLQKEMNEAKKQMEELEEATGLNKKDDSALYLWLATLPSTDETVEDKIARSLNTDLNDVSIESKLELNLV